LKVYLAGPISGLTYGESTDWRESIQNKLAAYGISGVSPMRGKWYLEQEKVIKGSYEDHALSSKRGITTRDRWDCQRCDAILVNLLGAKKVSIGTMIELGWADSARKPIVLVMEPDNIHAHPIVNEVAGFTCTTLDEAVDVLIALDKLST
jgi:nucleoside 2-deoxyribosyltransferase